MLNKLCLDRQTIFLMGLFFSFYLFLGFFIYSRTGTPNATNDFYFHFYKARGEFNEILVPRYSLEDFNTYPPLFHLLLSSFSFNPFLFYAAGVFLICVLLPYLLYLNAGSGAVLTYFLGVSLPHLAVNAAVYPFILVFCLFAFYLSKRRNWALLIVSGFLAALAHGEGSELFLIVGFAEIAAILFKFRGMLGMVYLADPFNPFRIVAGLLTHLNFALIWFCRNQFNFFYALIFGISVIQSFGNLRALGVAQIIICILAGKELKARPRWWFAWALLPLFVFNFLDFLTITAKFLY